MRAVSGEKDQGNALSLGRSRHFRIKPDLGVQVLMDCSATRATHALNVCQYTQNVQAPTMMGTRMCHEVSRNFFAMTYNELRPSFEVYHLSIMSTQKTRRLNTVQGMTR